MLPFAAARTSLPALKGVKTPVFMMQGRRDFAFGMEHALNAYRALAGPKRAVVRPLTAMPPRPASRRTRRPCSPRAPAGSTGTSAARPRSTFGKPVAISPESWTGQPVRFAGVPKVVTTRTVFAAKTAFGQSGKLQRALPRLTRPTEVFGSPVVQVSANATGGWSRIVAVLSARTPAGKEIVVAGGGVPAKAGKRTYRIVLGNQATFLPKGSKLTVTIASSSLAQNPGNLLYLDLPFPSTARLAVAGGSLRLPQLATPVSR